MKTKNASSLVVGIIITVFVIILVGGIIIWSSGYFDQNKKTLNKSTAKIDKTIGSMTNFDLDVYDGLSIRGEELTELIAEMKKSKVVVSVGVKTLAGGPTYYNYAYIEGSTTDTTKPGPNVGDTNDVTPTSVKKEDTYINPTAAFIGKIIKNKNDDIVCVLFTQQP